MYQQKLDEKENGMNYLEVTGWPELGMRYSCLPEDELKKLRDGNRRLKKQLILSEEQNYCKICGRILDLKEANKWRNKRGERA